MVEVFKSDRLQYLRVDNDEKLDKFFLALEREPHNLNLNITVQSGHSNSSTAALRDLFSKTKILFMYICLPGAAPIDGSPADGKSTEPTPIGVVSVTKPLDVMAHHGSAEIGIVLSAKYQGKGYGSEVLRWVLWWGFAVARLHRIEIACMGWNKGALRLYQRLGFVLEATKRRAVWCMGTWHDRYELAMLEDEWRELRRKDGHDDDMTTDKLAKLMGSD